MDGGFRVLVLATAGPGDGGGLGQFFGLHHTLPKAHAVYRLLKVVQGGFPPIVGLDLEHGDDKDAGFPNLGKKHIFGRVKEIGIFHMVIGGKLPAGDPPLEIPLDILLAVFDLLLVRLQNIVLELLVDRLGAGVVGYIHRLLKKHTGDGRKDHHQEKDQDNGPLYHRRDRQPGGKSGGGPQHCPGRAACRCSGGCSCTGRGGPRKRGSRPDAAVYPSVQAVGGFGFY